MQIGRDVWAVPWWIFIFIVLALSPSIVERVLRMSQHAPSKQDGFLLAAFTWLVLHIPLKTAIGHNIAVGYPSII